MTREAEAPGFVLMPGYPGAVQGKTPQFVPPGETAVKAPDEARAVMRGNGGT